MLRFRTYRDYGGYTVWVVNDVVGYLTFAFKTVELPVIKRVEY